MRTPSMVPSTNWSEADMFAAHADLNSKSDSQELLCMACVQMGVTEAPRKIVMVSGTSVCTEHM